MARAGEQIEASAGHLTGRRLDDVRYYTLPYGMTDEPAWDHGLAHVADYGIDLVTSDGTIGITWTQYGAFGYGLQICRGPLVDGLARAEFCSVAREPPWAAVLGQHITAARVCWLDVTSGEREAARPAAVALRFVGGNSIAVVCGPWNGPDRPVFSTGDDIVIL